MSVFHRGLISIVCCCAFALNSSCDSRKIDSDRAAAAVFAAAAGESAAFVSGVEKAAGAAGLPAALTAELAVAARDDRAAFESELLAAMSGDEYLTRLVDKKHGLPEAYEPADLIDLDKLGSKSFTLSRPGHKLRAPAVEALEKMAAAAREAGISIMVSSAYRSYSYQKTVYERAVRVDGQEAADRESARPGFSQHQAGLAADFGSISDAFAETAASRWLEENAARFGWSLSYPKGYETITGYRWESWHYRYVGEAAAALIDRRFGGVQQYALAFLNERRKPAAE